VRISRIKQIFVAAILDSYLCQVPGVINAPKIRLYMLRAYHVYLSNRILHIHMTPHYYFFMFFTQQKNVIYKGTFMTHIASAYKAIKQKITKVGR
jgi:hypothetical protein